MPFHIGGRVGVGIWEFVNDEDGPAFLKREPVGLGRDRYW